MASHLNQPHFKDADKAREYLESMRWPSGPICPHCGTVGAHYAITAQSKTGARPGLYKCKDCREQFTVTVGTVFERSKIALNIWLQAVYLICSSKKGISSHQLHRTLGVTYKTAWFISHRIREAMTNNPTGLLGSGGGIVEADETFWGNKAPYGQGNKRKNDKMKILSLVERGGKVRSFHVPRVNGATLKPILQANLAKETRLMTDQYQPYKKIGNEFASHETVNHDRGEYARGDVTANTVEGYFSILKRGLIGTYHHVGEQHLKRYVSEFDFRFNNRTALGVTEAQRTDEALKGISEKRLTYRRTHEAT